MDDIEGHDEQTGETEDFSREGESKFFEHYAENELEIESDSERPSNSRTAKREADDDGDVDDEGEDRAAADRRSDDPTDDDDDLDDERKDADQEDKEEDEEESDSDEDEDEGGDEQKAKATPRERTPAPELDEDFLEAAGEAKLPTDFEEIVKQAPAESRKALRSAFNKVLTDVKAGYTRLSQGMTEWRGKEKALTGQAKFIEEHPVDAILEILYTKPDVLAKVNERYHSDPRAQDIEKKHIANVKKDFTGEVAQKVDAQHARQERGRHLQRLSERLVAHHGIALAAVEDAIILRIKESPNGDISDDELRQLIKEKAKLIKGDSTTRKREVRSEWVRGKIRERERGKSPTARARSAQGRVAAPSRREGKKLTLEQNIARSVSRIAPDMARD